MAKLRPLSVFCSYSRRDERLRAQVATGLAGLVREGLIREAWYDRMTSPGDKWADAIDQNLEESDIILFLVSKNFIASDYCMGKEVVRAMARHDKGDACVIPIILAPCDWKNLVPFDERQALPLDGKPLRAWTVVNDQRLVEVSTGMRKAAMRLLAGGNGPSNRRSLSMPDANQTVLAYLCNRVEQDRQLREAWKLHYSSFALRRRPFVCVVHGRVQEDHPGYFRRLSDYFFPQEIGLGRDFEIHRPLKVPLQPDSVDKISGLSSMLRNLAKELNCPTEINEVSTTLYRLGETCVAYYELFTSFKNYADRFSAEAFFEFWRDWPELPIRQKLIVVLSVQYRPGFPARFPNVDTDILTNVTKNDRLSAVVLDELPSVSSQHVKDWIRHPEVERFCDVDNNASAWELEIDDTFMNRSQIPMEQLVGTLNRMLNEYQRRPV